MTTLHLFNSPQRTPARESVSLVPASGAPGSSIGADLDSLAQHMRHCASSRHRQSRFQLALQDAHGLASPRIVTLAAVATFLAVALASGVVSLIGLV